MKILREKSPPEAEEEIVNIDQFQKSPYFKPNFFFTNQSES